MTFRILACLVSFPVLCSADIITEFGVGYKFENSSAILQDWCKRATISDPHKWPDNPRGHSPKNPGGSSYSCGGDNPVFIGWPIAWETSGKYDVFYVRAGWFHFSHWGDGGSTIFNFGDRNETHMDLAAVVFGINWTNRNKKRNRPRGVVEVEELGEPRVIQ